MLGPAAIGNVSVALLAVAIAEALSDTGLAQAVIQGEHAPTRPQLSAVWTTLTARGVLISLLLVAVGAVVIESVSSRRIARADSTRCVAAAVAQACIAGLFVVQRERRFQHIAGVEVAAAFVDCSVGLHAQLISAPARRSVLIGLVAGETLKSVLTWATMTPAPAGDARVWSGIWPVCRVQPMDLGKQCHQPAAADQFDKVVVGKLLEADATRRLSDVVAASRRCCSPMRRSRCRRYLFPTFAAHHRRNARGGFQAHQGLSACSRRWACCICRDCCGSLPSRCSRLIPRHLRLPAVPLFRILVINTGNRCVDRGTHVVSARNQRCRSHCACVAIQVVVLLDQRALANALVGRDRHCMVDDAGPQHCAAAMDALQNPAGAKDGMMRASSTSILAPRLSGAEVARERSRARSVLRKNSGMLCQRRLLPAHADLRPSPADELHAHGVQCWFPPKRHRALAASCGICSSRCGSFSPTSSSRIRLFRRSTRALPLRRASRLRDAFRDQ